MTTIRSPASTCWVVGMASRATVPATGVVIAASIFMASMVATGWPATTDAPTSTFSVTTPEKGAATWPGRAASAFSAVLVSTFTERSRTFTGRSWPFSVVMTVRSPFSSTSPMASRPTNSRTPLSISTTCSVPGWRP